MKTTSRLFADRLAYVAITGSKRLLMRNTSMQMLEFTTIHRGNGPQIVRTG